MQSIPLPRVCTEIDHGFLVQCNLRITRPHLALQVFGPMERDDVNARGLSRHHIMQAVEQSLHRLHSDYIDLYQACFFFLREREREGEGKREGEG